MSEQGLPQPGARISEFELGEPIGTGGFGAVYRALQPRLEREVAIKVLFANAAHDAEKLARRFLREIDLVRRLEHPNIVRLYDYGETDDGLLWMAMELVRGEELRDILKREGRLEPRRARRIMLQVLSALSEAHQRNIVHRDLKPGNIMLCASGADRDVVKLLDFGIGKAFGDGENAAVQNLTVEESAIFGTPRYMAPELLMREHEGPHCDVYAAGLILYEMLEGHPAVHGESTFQILARQMKESILFSDTLARSAFAPLVARATAKSWRTRFPDALEFHAALERLDLSARPNPVTDPMLATLDSPAALTSGAFATVTGELFDDVDDWMDEITVVEEDGSEVVEPLGTSLPRSPAVTRDPPPTRAARRSLIMACAAATVVLVAAVAAVLTSGTDSIHPRAASAAATQLPDAPEPPSPRPHLPPAATPVEVAPPQPPAQVVWRFSSLPPGASVRLGDTLLCDATPCQRKLTRADAPLEVRFALDGYTARVETVVPSDPGAIELVLQPLHPPEQETASHTDDERAERRNRKTRRRNRDDHDAAKNPFEIRAD